MITIKRWTDGEVIYTSDCNTIKEAVEEAHKNQISLQFADLKMADLKYANLPGINLRNADLQFADLRYTNLRFAYLQESDLKDTDLRFTDLYGADLRFADLKSAKTDFGTLKNLFYISDIGCNNDIAEIYNTDKGIFIKCGCFQDTLEKFESQVKETYKESKFEKDYLAMIEFIKRKFE